MAGLRRRRTIVALAAASGLLVGLLSGAALLVLAPQQVSSEASVLVLPAIPVEDINVSADASTVNMDTEVQILGSVQVAAAVQADLGTSDTLRELLGRVSAFIQPNSQVMTVVYTADSPEEAQQGAESFAEQYLSVRGESAQATISDVVDSLEDQLTGFQADLEEVVDEVVDAPLTSARRSLADARRVIIIGQINDTNSQLLRLRATQASPGTVISTASLPESSERSATTVLVVLGAAGALVGSIAGEALYRVRSARGSGTGDPTEQPAEDRPAMADDPPPDVESVTSASS